MNITESRDEAFEAIAEMLRSNIKKTKIASKLATDYCVSDKTVYKCITKVEEMYDIEPIESILQQQKSELKSEIYQDLIRDYHKAKTDKDDEEADITTWTEEELKEIAWDYVLKNPDKYKVGEGDYDNETILDQSLWEEEE